MHARQWQDCILLLDRLILVFANGFQGFFNKLAKEVFLSEGDLAWHSRKRNKSYALPCNFSNVRIPPRPSIPSKTGIISPSSSGA